MSYSSVIKMRKIKSVLLLSLSLLLFTTTCVQVYALGTLRIFPFWPIMTGTQETFELWVEGGGTAYYPQLFLVMTETCHNALTQVEIDFHDDGVDKTLYPGLPDFTKETDENKWLPPDPAYPEGIRYTVASLKSHIGIDGTDESIFWALVDIPDPINGPPNYEITITLTSNNPKMMVYVFGKTVNSALADYDIKVPPTNPGFMTPEPATIAAVATPTLTLLAYALYKRKTIFS